MLELLNSIICGLFTVSEICQLLHFAIVLGSPHKDTLLRGTANAVGTGILFVVIGMLTGNNLLVSAVRAIIFVVNIAAFIYLRKIKYYS